MTRPATAWVAGGVRARALTRRAAGPSLAEAVAGARSLEAALSLLGETAYARELRPGMDLAAAQHAVAATLAWHLRVLAGWLPRSGAGALRVLAGWFEIRNIEDRLAVLAGAPARPVFALGSLATAWRLVAAAPTPDAVRDALAASAWGDPGMSDAAGLHLALRLAWAERVRRHVPEAAGWADSAALLMVCRELAAERRLPPGLTAGPPLVHRVAGAGSVDEVVRRLPRADARILAGAGDLAGLWRAEEGWWAAVEREGASLLGQPRPGRGTVIGAAAALAVDARRVRGALARAAGAAPRGA